ncbi:MAG: DNA-3-methyladenine glycosylase [Cytophagales bacterium]|nr:DNA-3-methyladenine glycosylase [Cytophagales bacterium]MDW8384139.1 DNA-3-methyladenine glycosylase [Flammeovirgaceae bacterium]
MKVLPRNFYERNDVVLIAQELIGKTLCTLSEEGIFTSGMITETEAYCGATDKACHAYLNKKTKRTQVMFGKGGTAYVYLCYGIHALFNVVTNAEGFADAVLIRSIQPLEGIEIMKQRRKGAKGYALTTGPGAVSAALGIKTSDYGTDLTLPKRIWIEDAPNVPLEELIISPRVGIEYAQEDALLPWRFRLKTPWVSK